MYLKVSWNSILWLSVRSDRIGVLLIELGFLRPNKGFSIETSITSKKTVNLYNEVSV